jgi:hypothetical protein
MARIKSVLGDVRRDERAEWMLERIVASGSLRAGPQVAHQIARIPRSPKTLHASVVQVSNWRQKPLKAYITNFSG